MHLADVCEVHFSVGVLVLLVRILDMRYLLCSVDSLARYTLELQSCSAMLPASPTCSAMESGSGSTPGSVNQRLAVVGFAALFVGLVLLIRRRMRNGRYNAMQRYYEGACDPVALVDGNKHIPRNRGDPTTGDNAVPTIPNVCERLQQLNCMTEQIEELHITGGASGKQFASATEKDGLLAFAPKRSPFKQPTAASTALEHTSHADEDEHTHLLPSAKTNSRHKRRGLPVLPGARVSVLGPMGVDTAAPRMHGSAGSSGV